MGKFFSSIRRLALVAAGLVLVPPGTASAQQAGPQIIACNKTATGSSGAATTLAITGVAPTVPPSITPNINICGFVGSAGAAAGTFQIVTGTGATCGTGTVTVTGVANLAVNSNISYSPGNAWYTVPQGNSVCVVITGTGPVGWTLFYSQF